MSPVHTPDPTQVSAFFHLFPKGDYLFNVGEAKPFEGTNQKGDANSGLRYPLICSDVLADGDSASVGKKQMFTCYTHSEGALSFSKRFLMACLGFSQDNDGEMAFNEKYAGQDWKVDPDPDAPYVGEVWQSVNNSSLIMTTDIKLNEGIKTQDWKAMRAVSEL